MLSAGAVDSYEAGHVAGAGSYKCSGCGLRIGLDRIEEVPHCPACGDTRFRRAPLFRTEPESDPQATTALPATPAAGGLPSWLAETRAELRDGERYLVFEDDGDVRVEALAVGWSRIGRSVTSDIRLDDPTVSRRHALVVRSQSGEVRVLDDRSLNGVRLNDSLVEWGSLADGDELAIGRFRLYLVALEPAGSRDSEPALAD